MEEEEKEVPESHEDESRPPVEYLDPEEVELNDEQPLFFYSEGVYFHNPETRTPETPETLENNEGTQPQRQGDQIREAQQVHRFYSCFQYSLQSFFLVIILTKLIIFIVFLLNHNDELSCDASMAIWMFVDLGADVVLLFNIAYLFYKIIHLQFTRVKRAISLRFLIQIADLVLFLWGFGIYFYQVYNSDFCSNEVKTFRSLIILTGILSLFPYLIGCGAIILVSYIIIRSPRSGVRAAPNVIHSKTDHHFEVSVRVESANQPSKSPLQLKRNPT